MRLRGSTLVITIATLVALAGCGSGKPPRTPFTVPPAASTSAGTAAVDPKHGSVSGLDTKGDGGAADILDVTLTLSAAAMTVSYKLARPLPTTGTAMLSLLVSSHGGDQSRQLAVKYIDGEPLVFVFDSAATPMQTNLVLPPRHLDSTLTVDFPPVHVAGLGASFEWHVVSTIDGTDVDEYPNVGAEAVFPA